MQGLKMRPMPDPDRLPQQSAVLNRFMQLKRDGYGAEDIAAILKSERMPVPIDHVRSAMGFKAKAQYMRGRLS